MVFGFDLRSRQISWKPPSLRRLGRIPGYRERHGPADCTWHMASAYDGEQLSQVEALASFKTLFFFIACT